VSLIESLSRGALGLRADVSGTPAPWDDYWYNPLGNQSSSGMRVSAESAKRIATVLACVNIIGRNTGMTPCKVMTEAPDGSKRIMDHHPVYDILYSRPNSLQTAFEWKQMMQGHLELRGNAYSEIKPGPRGAVDELVPMHPDRVVVERMKESGRLRYQYNDPLIDRTRVLLQEEVFHLRNFSDDGATGQSTITMACDLFGVALAQQDYSARFLKNDARPPIALEGAPNAKNKADRDMLRESWQEGQTAANRGKVAILPAGVTIKELGVKPIDQQLLDAQKFSRIQICSIFPVPPHMIGETEKTATYASVEQFNIFFAVQCMLSRFVLWEQAIQRDLLTSPRYFSKFFMAALLRGDTASRYAAYHQAIGDGWMCQDEVRALEDLNPMPNSWGRYYWRPANWMRIDQAAPAPAQLPAGTADSEDDDPGAADQGGTSDQGGGSDQNGPDAAAVRLHLKALATSAGERCARKEIAALRKMIERGVDGYKLEEFYADQHRFTTNALALTTDRQTALRQEYYGRAEQLAGWVAAGDKGSAMEYVDRLAVKEPLRLAGLVTGGAQ
jgi:HK97 family phage portal protein